MSSLELSVFRDDSTPDPPLCVSIPDFPVFLRESSVLHLLRTRPPSTLSVRVPLTPGLSTHLSLGGGSNEGSDFRHN